MGESQYSKLNSKFCKQKSLSGIYFHIPFCKKACHYCNFHFSTSLSKKDDMIDAIIQEVRLSAFQADQKDEHAGSFSSTPGGDSGIATVYFGGGTPSLLTGNELKRMMQALYENFQVWGDAEVTMEANPDDISAKNLEEWKSAGVNRLSIGVQSFINHELQWMNRVHDAAQSLQCIHLVQEAGFDNFSVDMIYGTPGLSVSDWEKNITSLIGLQIPHISCYALTVEPGTALKKMITLKKRADVDPEQQRTQFLLMTDWLELAGYEHYEISNFARPGLRSKHNSGYWQGKHYRGFGPSAHSFDGQTRKWNISNNEFYMKSIKAGFVPSEHEVLTNIQQLNEYIMTSIRTLEGTDLEYIAGKFGTEKSERLAQSINRFKNNGNVQAQDSKIILTREGKLFADGIAADLFFDELPVP
ncbi:MAG: radical SAM family heme chaperone HemW [Ginsengibacter sp.]